LDLLDRLTRRKPRLRRRIVLDIESAVRRANELLEARAGLDEIAKVADLPASEDDDS
jgi:hypothetical protein